MVSKAQAFVLAKKKRSKMKKAFDRTCDQCTANTNGGKRCLKRTCKSGLCWIHLQKKSGVRVKKSEFGMGLFAARDIPARTIIDKYSGEEMTRNQVKERYGNTDPQYTLCVGNKCVDARETNSCAARFANTTVGKKNAHRRNATLTHAFNLKSKKKIPKGREILTTYGNSFRIR